MKRKSLFFIDPQSYNNLAMYDYEILSRMKGWNVYFFGNKLYDYKPLPEINVNKVFSYSKYKNPLAKAVSYIVSLFLILIWIISVRPALIHIQWIRIPRVDYCFYSFVKTVFRVKLLYTVHNVLPHIPKPNDKVNYGRFYHLCDCLIAHTEKTRLELETDFDIEGAAIIVAPHGPLKYDFEESDLERCVHDFSKKYSLDNKIVFSMLGNQSYYKGTDLVIDAWSGDRCLCNTKEALLLIGGEFKEGRIPDTLPDNIIYIPRRFTDLEFAALLRLTSVLLLPYRRIEQSGLLLTALNENIPYCATDCGELIKPIQLADIGWIIKDSTPDGIANLIKNIIDKKDDILKKRTNSVGWGLINKYYDWSQNVDVTTQAYIRLSE